jgi:hypothetical protein
MNTSLVSLQLGLLVLGLPLLATSVRTTRLNRTRHQACMALAALLALLVSVLAMLSLADLGGAADSDLVLSFVPPAITLLMCGVVLRRGLQVDSVRVRRRRS